MNSVSIGQTLRAAREAQRFSQEQVAETYAWNPTPLPPWRRNAGNVSCARVCSRSFASYARLLGIEPAALLLRMPLADEESMGEEEFRSGGVNPWLVAGALSVVAVVAILC